MSESTIRLLLVSLFLWTAAIPDLKTKRIPVWIPAAFLAAALAADYCFLKEMSGQELRMGVIPGIILLLLSAISKGRIGEGDGICLIVCGILTGITNTILIAEIALLLSSASAVALLITKRLRANYLLPFIPFLAAASSLLVLSSFGRL